MSHSHYWYYEGITMTKDTTPARVAAAAEVIATNRRRWAIEDGTTPPLNDLTLRDLELAAAVVAAIEAQPGDAQQAGGLTDDERNTLGWMVNGWPGSFAFRYQQGEMSSDGIKRELYAAVESILAARAAGGPDTPNTPNT